MGLKSRHLRKVCLQGQGAQQCRFLDHHPQEGYVCVKVGPEFAEIRIRVQKRSARGVLTTQGDNCEGVQ